MKIRLLSFVTLSILLNGFSPVQGQNMGIGIKIGDPLGITFKKYFDDKAIELVFGRTSYWNRYDYHHYNDIFYKRYKYDYNKYHYYGYSHRTPLSLQIHFLKSSDLKDVEGLKVYYGGGIQFRFGTIVYNYWYEVNDPYLGRYDVYETDRKILIDTGLDGVIGLEYTFKDAPISIFADVNLFIELYDDFFQPWGQGGLGARYNF